MNKVVYCVVIGFLCCISIASVFYGVFTKRMCDKCNKNDGRDFVRLFFDNDCNLEHFGGDEE